jgi:hypothetical protein
LTPASGRQDHTTSPYASASFVRAQKARDDAAASTASRPNVRDDGQRPSFETGRPLKATDLLSMKTKIFFKPGLDTDLLLGLICPTGYFDRNKALLTHLNPRRHFAFDQNWQASVPQ